jgi:hypothetical protein
VSPKSLKSVKDALGGQLGAGAQAPRFGIYACWSQAYNDSINEKNRVAAPLNEKGCVDPEEMAKHFNDNFDKTKAMLKALCAKNCCNGKVVVHLYFGAWAEKDKFTMKWDADNNRPRIFPNWKK